ncbi:endolytic transglycosylase MltG [Candidatus Uhrbacteria bacterium]|nr:endolytic transglycosylase MltG [Candidatus Uhrbacteria bacterium]
MLRTIGIFLGIVFVLGVVLAGGFVFDAFIASPEEEAESVMFEVKSGDSVSEIAEDLNRAGIITSELFFKIYVKLTGNASNLQAGSFELTSGMNFRTLVAELTNAQAQEAEITIPEGYTVKQIGESVMEALPEIELADWEAVVSGNDLRQIAGIEILDGIPADQGLEGYLFPDTYRFRADANAATVAETMILTLKRRLAENNIAIPRNSIFEGGLTFHEMLTMASIVEREVRDPEDMKLVAGIFYTRMKIGMALQADSTVNYVTGKSDTSISQEDSRVNSPYNTYQNLGLPPGPISNPGMNAIMAVLEPTDSDYLYFLTTPEGDVIYASTFDEHIANKYKYLK